MKTSKKVSVVHINDAITPGGSLVVMDSLIKGTSKENIENRAIIADRPENLDITLDNIEYDVLRHKYSYLEHSQLISSIEGKNKYIRLLYLLAFEAKKKIYDFIYLFKIIQILKNKPFDLIHIHSTLLPCFACILTKSPFIYHLHGLHAKYTKTGVFLMNSAQSIIAISNYIAQTAIKHGISKDKITVLANPLRPSPMPRPLKESYKSNTDEVLIGHFGRIVPWKGQLEFIEAFAIVKKNFPHISAIIVGEVTDGNDEYFQSLTDRIADLNIQDSIHFLGYKNNTADYYNICDIIVHSSIEPEPFGLVIIESMAAGKPVIASSLGAAPEIIDDGITGLIADPRDKDKLSAQIISLVKSTKLRGELGANAQIEVDKSYRLDFIAKKFSSMYKEISDL